MTAPSDRVPTTSAHVARLRMFQATRSPVNRTGEWVTTPWGRSRVKGPLGTQHETLMEVLHYTALNTFREPAGRVSLLIDPYAVRRMLSARSGGQYSATTLDRLIDDLRNADVEWELTSGQAGGVAKIISEKDWAKVTKNNPIGGRNMGRGVSALPATRRLWRITLSKPWVALVEGAGLATYRDPTPVIRIQHAAAQAATRLMLTHKPGARYAIDTVLDAIGIAPTGQSRRDARRFVRASAREMAAAGVAVDGDMLETMARGTQARSTLLQMAPNSESVEPRPGSVEPRPGVWSPGPDVWSPGPDA